MGKLSMQCADIVAVIEMSDYSRSYSELLRLPTFEDRLKYLMLFGDVGEDTFGHARYLNQDFYRSQEWRRCRDAVIIRDLGCDLAIPGRTIPGRLYVHHINPITEHSLVHGSDALLDMDNLILVSHATHNAIHYGNLSSLLASEPVVRRPNDTIPWKD